jgi:hypothetical protein
MAQAAPDFGSRQGSRGRKRAPAAQRGRGGVSGLVRLGTFLAALPRAMVSTMARWRQIGGSGHHSDDSTLSTCMIRPRIDVRGQFVGVGEGGGEEG